MDGRKNVFPYLQNRLTAADQVIWIHTASLGEFEQGLPIIERLKKEFPTYKIIVTFFSPSGYEVKKNSGAADLITYLPLDSASNAKKFIDTVHPALAIFVKYEIWPNYLQELARKNVPVILISALFKEQQLFFKSYGGFMRQALARFTHIFVQNEASVALLHQIGYHQVSLGGDTRFDRVMEILERDNTLPFMAEFKGGSPILVAGSTWPEDEKILVPQINTDSRGLKYVLAPHNINPQHIARLKASIHKKTILYSEIAGKDLEGFDVLIVDTIGLLTKIYSYAQMAYVGGGFASGLHNTLEPATFGIPVIIGPQFQGFNEAQELVALGGILVVESDLEYQALIENLLTHSDYLARTGAINRDYVTGNKGASDRIMQYIHTLI